MPHVFGRTEGSHLGCLWSRAYLTLTNAPLDDRRRWLMVGASSVFAPAVERSSQPLDDWALALFAEAHPR
jgi:hypothetical protein